MTDRNVHSKSTALPLELPMGMCRCETHIARGGQADIFKGQLLYPHRALPCAIKILRDLRPVREELRQRFIREAMVGLNLSPKHPNLATTLGYNETEDGRLFLVCELIEGPTLRQASRKLRDNHALIRSIARSAIFVLHHLHRHGYVHCDVQPNNLMLSSDGWIKLIDLGLLRRQDSYIEGALAGVAEYKSPEELTSRQFSPKSDFYSLGAVLYELLGGQPPYGFGDFTTIASRMRPGPLPALPSTTPDDLRRLITALMQSNPEDRPTIDSALGLLNKSEPLASEDDISEFAARWQGQHSHSFHSRQTAVQYTGKVVSRDDDDLPRPSHSQQHVPGAAPSDSPKGDASKRSPIHSPPPMPSIGRSLWRWQTAILAGLVLLGVLGLLLVWPQMTPQTHNAASTPGMTTFNILGEGP
ncbi:MAG: serine/threonine-protein kinase [Myxococcota bacterium]